MGLSSPSGRAASTRIVTGNVEAASSAAGSGSMMRKVADRSAPQRTSGVQAGRIVCMVLGASVFGHQRQGFSGIEIHAEQAREDSLVRHKYGNSRSKASQGRARRSARAADRRSSTQARTVLRHDRAERTSKAKPQTTP